MSPARTALVDWLRQCSDDELAGLLAARPDLLHPVPSDVAVLANRATGRASVEIALDRLDVATLHVVEAFALVPEPADQVAIAAALGVTVESVTTPIARLRQAMLVWGADDALWLAAVVRDLMPTPANLGPPVRVLLEQLPAGQLARLVVDLGLDLVETGHGADGAAAAAISAVAGVLEDPQQVTALLDRMPPGAREVVELLAQGPPTGRVPAARRTVTAATADSPVRWLLAHGLLIAVDDYSVVLPREVALVVRGGHAFHDITLDPPTPVSTRYEQADVDAAAAGQAFTVVRLIESLLERWGVEPPAMLRSGGLGVRELRRTARELDVDETTAALLIEVAHAAGLVAADAETGDSWVPTMAYDVWLAKSSSDRWAMVAAAWLTTTRVVGLIGRREPTLLLGVGALGPGAGGVTSVGAVDRASAANALGPDVDRALAPVVRRDLLRLLVDSAAGVALTLDSLGAILRWSSPRRGGRLRDDLVGWSHAEAEFLGITGRGAVSSFGRRLCELVLGDVTEGPAQSVGDPVDPVRCGRCRTRPAAPSAARPRVAASRHDCSRAWSARERSGARVGDGRRRRINRRRNGFSLQCGVGAARARCRSQRGRPAHDAGDAVAHSGAAAVELPHRRRGSPAWSRAHRSRRRVSAVRRRSCVERGAGRPSGRKPSTSAALPHRGGQSARSRAGG